MTSWEPVKNAIEILEKYGLGNERDGIDDAALIDFERKHSVTDLQPSDSDTNSKPSKAQ